jgi:hypothetical protein
MIDQPGHRDRGLEQGHGSRGLNNAYAILENRVGMQIAAEGLDPTIGFLHTSTPERQATGLGLNGAYTGRWLIGVCWSSCRRTRFIRRISRSGEMAFAGLILRWLDALFTSCTLQGDRSRNVF